ncbi:hypothetical protein CLU79DRAFT_840134 [Phycomyces nitens]|nr:hypothetical protein CLU79DRAFT_840134 [Phycomyces nitens]
MSEQLFFADNFWENDQINGTSVLNNRMRDAKHSCEILRQAYEARASLEQDYGNRMMQIAQDIQIPDGESGGLRDILNTVQQGLESTGENRLQLSEAIKAKLVLPLSNLIQRQKTIKAQANKDHEESMSHLETAVNDWNTEWRFGCELFEQLEEERIEFFRENLAGYYTLLIDGCETKESFDTFRQTALAINADKELDRFVRDNRSTSTIPTLLDYISFSANTDPQPEGTIQTSRDIEEKPNTPSPEPPIEHRSSRKQEPQEPQEPQEAPKVMVAHMKIYDWESDEDQDSDEDQATSPISNEPCHPITSSPLPITSSNENYIEPVLDMPAIDADFNGSSRASSPRINDELEDMLRQLENQKASSSIGSARGTSLSSRFPPRQRPAFKNNNNNNNSNLQRNESVRSISSTESSASDDVFDPVSKQSTMTTLSSIDSTNQLGTTRRMAREDDQDTWQSGPTNPSHTNTELVFVDYGKFETTIAAKDEDEISFTKGDLLGIIDKHEDGWWLSHCWNEESGWSEQGCAPSNYLSLVEE